MKRVGLIFLTIVALVGLAIQAPAQQPLGLGVKAQMSVGRGEHLGQGLGLTNVWVLKARHCDEYASTMKITGENGSVEFKYLTDADRAACNADDSVVYQTFKGHNLVTNAGYDLAAANLSGTAVATCHWIAFAADSSNAGVGTVAITDTTLASSGTGSTEIATNGLSRADSSAGYSHSAGTLTYALTHAFSITGTSTGVNKLGVFNASSSGTMCYELLFTAVTVNNLDTLTPTLTVTMSNP